MPNSNRIPPPPGPTDETMPEIPIFPGTDTAFFMSRGRHLMFTPMQELLAICDRLALQARALGRDSMAPDFEIIAEAARHLVSQLEDGDKTGTQHRKLTSIMAGLASSAQAGARWPTRLPPLASPRHQKTYSVLVVEDNPRSSDVVSLLLEQDGHQTTLAVDGEKALQKIEEQTFDLVLLDILLPEINGYQVLQTIRSTPRFHHLPVIVLSGVSEMDSVVRCIEMGADDYLPKPFNPVLLRARIEACLEKKWLRDKEEASLHQLQIEREKSEILLRSILPEPIAERLKQGEQTIVDHFEDATVLFADLVGFSKLASRLTPQELVQTLNGIFTEFDRLADEHGLEKIKTIGDAYMLVGGLPTPSDDHPSAVASMALAMQQCIRDYNRQHGSELNIRIGLHTGPVIAGIIGRNKFTYDLWGDTVNVASRMESQGQPGAIQLTIVTAERIRNEFLFEPRGVIDVKGKGEMNTFLLLGRK